MNRDEAQDTLLLYRSSADLADPQVAEALTLAKSDRELARWFEEHCARQNALREKFRQIPVPAGLKGQIIYEQAARAKAGSRREKLALVGAVAAIVISLVVLAAFWLPHRRPGFVYTLANYQDTMVSIALSGYAMDLATNDLAQIRNYLARNQAPADYALPAPLEKTTATGCAIKTWGAAKVSMICFRTGKPLPPNEPGDLWLFVVDRASVKNSPAAGPPEFTSVNGIITATWTQDGKLYVLGTAGDETVIRKYL
jgi:hypothetical protein